MINLDGHACPQPNLSTRVSCFNLLIFYLNSFLQPISPQRGGSNNTSNGSSNSDAGDPSSSSSSNTGAIVGGVVGGIAALVLLGLLVFYLRRKRSSKKQANIISTGSDFSGVDGSSKSTVRRQPASAVLSSLPSSAKKGFDGSVSDGRAGGLDQNSTVTSRLDGAERGVVTTSGNDGTTTSGDRTGTSESADYGEWLKTARWEGINLINDISSDSLAERLKSTPGLAPLHLNPGDLSIDTDENGEYVLLGRGSAGSVFRGTLRGVQPVAGKILLYPGVEAEKAFLKEAAILQHVSRDRNIVQLYGIGAVKDKMVLVMELMEGGDLRNALDNDKDGVLQWQRVGKGIALDLARGLTALHSCKVIHRDLKSKNVLLSSFSSGNNSNNITAKLGDVGVAANLTHSYLSNSNKIVGTLAWSAPELLLGRRCDEKVDVYSLGVVLWELATGKMPRRGQIDTPEIAERCPQELADLIVHCTQEEPRARPSAKEVYERILKI